MEHNLKKYRDYIFDVGANDGTDGLGIALNNKDLFVHAFEANPYLVKKIILLRKKLEKRKGIIIRNYKIHQVAVSDKSKKATFNISTNHRVSSLKKLSKNLDKAWPGYRENIFKVTEKIKVDVISLNEFMIKNKIEKIRYLHIDTQGNDLNVLKGLKSKISQVQEGKMEAAINKKNAAYTNNHTINDVKKFISRSKLKIIKIVKIKHLSGTKFFKNEADIFFKNKNIIKLNNLNLNYNNRYFARIIDNRVNFKDDIFDFLSRLKNSTIK